MKSKRTARSNEAGEDDIERDRIWLPYPSAPSMGWPTTVVG